MSDKKVRLGLNLDKELSRKLKLLALNEETNQTAIIVELIKKRVEKAEL